MNSTQRILDLLTETADATLTKWEQTPYDDDHRIYGQVEASLNILKRALIRAGEPSTAYDYLFSRFTGIALDKLDQTINAALTN